MSKVKPVCLNLSECNGLGDLICATPTIKKISEAYNTQITVLSKMPELFKNNQNVNKSYKSTSVDIDYFESFAPTAAHITIRLVLAITAVPGFFSYDYDAVCAFNSAPLPA